MRSNRIYAVLLLMVLVSFSLSAEPAVKQITFGPEHHFFGYIGHVGNTPGI